MNNIEVEISSFISDELYKELISFFKENAELVKEDFQKTYYLNGKKDLRIQENNFYSKIWLKEGKLHDEAREELEIKFDKKDFKNISKLFESIGYEYEIKWIRDRKQFNYNGVKICIDKTKGYGNIIELEKMSNEENKNTDLVELRKLLKNLKIEETPKEVFQEKFEYYKKNWKELLED